MEVAENAAKDSTQQLEENKNQNGDTVA